MSIKQHSLSLIRRNAPYRGPRTSDSWNDTIDEISTDLAAIISDWNTQLYPLLDGVPDGTLDANVDAFVNGLDGAQLYADSNATATSENGVYWNTTNSRPRTIKEIINAVRDDVDSNYDSLAAMISESSGALTHDQKRGIGLEIFSDDYTFGGISLLSRSIANEFNTFQLSKDLYGATGTLDGDGLQNFLSGTSVSDALTNLASKHGGTWPATIIGDITFSHDLVDSDINASADIVQTKIFKSDTEASDTVDLGVDPVNTLLDDLNVARTIIRLLKGTATWGDTISEPYGGAPVTLQGHINNVGSGTAADTNPHGLTFDDVDGTDLVNIRSVLGIDALDSVPPYADFPPEGTTLTYISAAESLTEAVAKLDDVLNLLDIATDAHAADLANPHVVAANQIGANNIITEINDYGSTLIDWDNIDKSTASLSDFGGASNHSDLGEIGIRTHDQIDAELDSLSGTYLEPADVTYILLSNNGVIGNTPGTICAGDDPRLTEDDGSVTVHKYGYTFDLSGGPVLPVVGEHYATDIEVEDFYSEFTEGTVEMVLHELNLKIEGAFSGDNDQIAIDNVVSAPSAPTTGGILYVEAGALWFVGSSGTRTTIAAA